MQVANMKSEDYMEQSEMLIRQDDPKQKVISRPCVSCHRSLAIRLVSLDRRSYGR